MDYEKKYNNALDRARLAIKDCGDNQGRKNMIYDIFPELAESDDERIRSCIATVIKNQKECSLGLECNHGATWDEMLAYLEKQKGQEEPEKEELIYRMNGLMQKYVEESKDEAEREHRLKCYILYWDALNDPDAIEKTPKQDYSGLTDFERAIHRGFLCAGVANVPVGIIKDTAQDALTHIEKAEWSEEEEKLLDNWLEILNMEGWRIIDQKFCEDSHVFINKLKSLRPQFHWKPSEEQIDALDAVYKTHYMSPVDKSTILNLLNELKKL